MTLILKLLIVLSAFAVLATHVDVGDAFARLADLDPVYGVATTALVFAAHWMNAVKLHVVLPERSVRALFAATLAAQAYTLILPGQIAGEAAKAFRLRQGLDAGRIVSSVMFDKMTGVAAGLLLSLGGLASRPDLFGRQLAVLAMAGLLALVLTAVALSVQSTHAPLIRLIQGRTDREPGWFGHWRRWGGERLSQFLSTWRDHATSPRVILASLPCGLIAQALAVASSMTLGLGLGIDIGYAAWCVVIGALTVILLAPVTIGGLGLREVSLVGMLGWIRVPHDQALALALVILAFQLGVAAVGLVVDLLVPLDTMSNPPMP